MLKEISYEYSLEGLMLKLKLQYSGHLMWRTDPLENTLMLGKIEDRRRRGQQDEMVGWHHWLNGHEFEWIPGVGDGQGGLACCGPWGCKESDVTEWLNWTDSNSWLIGKVSDAGKEWGQKKRASEDEMAGWHHRYSELWQTPGDGVFLKFIFKHSHV